MSEQFVTKTYDVYKKDDNGKKVKTGTREETYRIDADFTPKEIGEISFEFIENYCVANNATDWLIEQVNETVACKDGKTRDKNFASIRSAFVAKYFPNVTTTSGKKAETFKERINRLYKK